MKEERTASDEIQAILERAEVILSKYPHTISSLHIVTLGKEIERLQGLVKQRFVTERATQFAALLAKNERLKSANDRALTWLDPVVLADNLEDLQHAVSLAITELETGT